MSLPGIKKESNEPNTPLQPQRTSLSAATTRIISEKQLLHLIENVLMQPKRSNIHRSLEYKGADTLFGFINFIENKNQQD